MKAQFENLTLVAQRSSRMVERAKAVARPFVVPVVLGVELARASRRLQSCSGMSDRSDKFTIACFYNKPNGLTRGAQLQISAMRRAGMAVSAADASSPAPRNRIREDGPRSVVLHSGAPECPRLLNNISLPGAGIYPIGYWAWELPDPPSDWKRYAGLVSEIWTPSSFSANALSQLFDVPIYVVPHRVLQEPRRIRGEKGPFTVLTMADSRSSFERKNPMAAIAAFRAAFGDRQDAQLVVKLSGRDGDIGQLIQDLGYLKNVHILTELLDLTRLRKLFRSADVLLSLHRAEGFGLPLLEAMAHGVPVVATAWSGNLDFMDFNNSALVPFKLVDVADRSGVYDYDSYWAEPDIAAAAEQLTKLKADVEHYSRMSIAAHNSVGERSAFEIPLRPYLPSSRSFGGT